MQSQMSPILVFCTCPPGDSAERIAKKLVEEKLAACVNIIDAVDSVYSWQGKIQYDREKQLLLKSAESLWPRLEQRIGELHPYEVPEVIALPIVAGSREYLSWLEENLCTV